MANWVLSQKISLALVRMAAENESYRSVLDALDVGIEETAARMRANGDDPNLVDWLPEDDQELIQSLVGTAFVVCQAQMTAVASRAVALSKRHCIGQPLFPDKAATFKRGSLFPDSLVTNAEVLWSLANYFKHHEEWPSDWSRLEMPVKKKKKKKKKKKGRQKGVAEETAATAAMVGLSPNAKSSNLRSGAEALGYSTTLDVLADVVDDWSKVIVRECAHALGLPPLV